jgi:hypothetical protein
MSLENAIIAGVIFERAAICGVGVLDASGEDERIKIDKYGRKMLRLQKRGKIKSTDTDEEIATKLTAGFWLAVASIFLEQIAPELLAWIIAAIRKRIWPSNQESQDSER